MINTLKEEFKEFKPYINGWQNMKRASVAVLITKIDNEECILFQVRSKELNSQPGDIGFPGGKIDFDETPIEAVKREIYEELGLALDSFEIISPLDIVVTHYDLLIHPFVGYIENLHTLCINKDEVDHIFFIPIKFFKNNTPFVIHNEIVVNRNLNFPYELVNNGENYKFKTGKYPTIFYKYDEYVIWGLTGKILENFINLIS